MITLKYSQLLDKNFNDALKKLMFCDELDSVARYRLSRLSKDVANGIKKAVSERHAILLNNAKLDDSGNFLLDETSKDFQWKDGIDMETVKKEVDGFGDRTVEIDRFQFNLSSFDNAKLSPIELSYLEPLIVLPEGE